MNRFDRESPAFVAVEVFDDGELVTSGVELSCTGSDIWVPASERHGKTGFMVEGFDKGHYRLWARVSTEPETVLEVGQFRVV